MHGFINLKTVIINLIPFLLYSNLICVTSHCSFCEIVLDTPVRSYPLPNEQGRIALSPDGTTFLSYGGKLTGGAITLWDIQTGDKIWEINEIADAAWAACFSHDNFFVAIAYRNSGLTELRDARTGEKIRSFNTTDRESIKVEFSLDDSLLAVGGRVFGTSIFDVNTGELKQDIIRERINWHNFSGDDEIFMTDPILRSLAFSSDGRFIVSALNDRSARIWDVETGEQTQAFVHPLPNVTGPVEAFFLNNDKNVITVDVATFDPDPLADHYTPLRLWDVKSERLINKLDMRGNIYTNASQVLRNGNILFIGGYTSTLVIDGYNSFIMETPFAQFFNINTEETIARIEYLKIIGSADFSSDETLQMTVNSDGYAHLWDVSALQLSSVDQWMEYKN